MTKVIYGMIVAIAMAFASSARADEPQMEGRFGLGTHIVGRDGGAAMLRDGLRREMRKAGANARRDVQRIASSVGLGPRPRAWCGWFMRGEAPGGDPGREYNLARNWAKWGRASGPQVGAIVVWPHHVGRIVARDGDRWVVRSGNDGHAVRERARSVAGAIAFRVAS